MVDRIVDYRHVPARATIDPSSRSDARNSTHTARPTHSPGMRDRYKVTMPGQVQVADGFHHRSFQQEEDDGDDLQRPFCICR